MCQNFPFFLRLANVLLYVYTTFSLFIHLLMATWIASTFWLLWLILLWTSVYKYLSEIILIWGGCISRSGIAGSYVTLFLIFWEINFLIKRQTTCYIPVGKRISTILQILTLIDWMMGLWVNEVYCLPFGLFPNFLQWALLRYLNNENMYKAFWCHYLFLWMCHNKGLKIPGP